MSNQSPHAPRPVPARPNLRQLKDQARDLIKAGSAQSVTDAQFKIAQLYGFPSWPKLKAHVESLNQIGQLKHAIDNNDLDRIKMLRAALRGERVPMMKLLVAHGANVNAEWNGDFPILFAPCESVDPIAIHWLLEHGANPDCPKTGRQVTALDYLIGTYTRSLEFATCIDILLGSGGTTRYDHPSVLDVLRDRADRLEEQLRATPELLHRRFADLDFGSTGARRLLLKGSTLLHIAAEYGSIESAKILLRHGASANARASVDAAGVGGQSTIFHAVTQFRDYGLAMTGLLLDAGADLTIRAKLPGHYENADEVVECTPLGYALRFPGTKSPGANERTVALLRGRGAPE